MTDMKSLHPIHLYDPGINHCKSVLHKIRNLACLGSPYVSPAALNHTYVYLDDKVEAEIAAVQEIMRYSTPLGME